MLQMLPNQTGVHSPDAQQSQSTDTGLWRSKVQCFLQGTKQRKGKEQLVLKRPELLNGFQGRSFKNKHLTSFEVQVAGCIISLWTFFWMAGGDVIGWCFKNIRRFLHHPFGSNQSGVYMFIVSCSHHPLSGCVWGGGLSFCGTTQRYSSECCVYPPWGETRTLFYCWIAVPAIITFLDWLVFPFHFLHSFTSLIVTILSLLFETQRRPRRMKLFLQTRMGDMKGFLCLGGPCRVLLSFTGTSQDQWRSHWS